MPAKLPFPPSGIERGNVVYSYLPQSGNKGPVVVMINARLMNSVADHLPRQLGIFHN